MPGAVLRTGDVKAESADLDSPAKELRAQWGHRRANGQRLCNTSSSVMWV